MTANDHAYREADQHQDVSETNGSTVVPFPAVTSYAAMSDLIDETSLAIRLGVSRATLQSWRYAGRGPSYIKIGRFIRYRNADIETFLDQNARGAVGGR
jgi:predicted DNA-binding transcriptional regulator AlpA